MSKVEEIKEAIGQKLGREGKELAGLFEQLVLEIRLEHLNGKPAPKASKKKASKK